MAHPAVTMISVLAGVGCHVLLCAPTNVAVGEVAQRFLHLIRSSQQPSSQPGDALYSPAAILPQDMLGSAGAASIGYGDVVLLASEDTVDVDSDLSLIFSQARAGKQEGRHAVHMCTPTAIVRAPTAGP